MAVGSGNARGRGRVALFFFSGLGGAVVAQMGLACFGGWSGWRDDARGGRGVVVEGFG